SRARRRADSSGAARRSARARASSPPASADKASSWRMLLTYVPRSMAPVWHHSDAIASHRGAKLDLYGSTWHETCAKVRQKGAKAGQTGCPGGRGRAGEASLERGARFCDLLQEAIDA